MRDFVVTLDKLDLDSFPGVALCGLANIDNMCVSKKTFRGLGLDTSRYWLAPHFQNNFIVFKKNPRNVKFLTEWRDCMTDMDMACASGTDDQALFSILVTKYKLKFLNMCNFDEGLNHPTFQALKNVDLVMEFVSLHVNSSRVMHDQSDFIYMWNHAAQRSPTNYVKVEESLEYYAHTQFTLPPTWTRNRG